MYEEVWRDIISFPGYAVSNEGRIANVETDRIMSISKNQWGQASVTLRKDRVKYTRTVSGLVADAFIPPAPRPDIYNSLINVDGDKMNNQVANIVRRPRWFALKYARQFEQIERYSFGPIFNITEKLTFPDGWAAILKYGILGNDIFEAIVNRTYVWPTYHLYEWE